MNLHTAGHQNKRFLITSICARSPANTTMVGPLQQKTNYNSTTSNITTTKITTTTTTTITTIMIDGPSVGPCGPGDGPQPRGGERPRLAHGSDAQRVPVRESEATLKYLY